MHILLIFMERNQYLVTEKEQANKKKASIHLHIWTISQNLFLQRGKMFFLHLEKPAIASVCLNPVMRPLGVCNTIHFLACCVFFGPLKSTSKSPIRKGTSVEHCHLERPKASEYSSEHVELSPVPSFLHYNPEKFRSCRSMGKESQHF
jgi:hypothetical protein